MLTAEQHYQTAYELDRAANDAYAQIEQHYQTAIKLDPTNPQYRASWVCYLQTRGRNIATDEAWDKAVEACPEAYDVLHFPVAQLALHRARLDFAERVLSAVPQEKRDDKFVYLQEELTLLCLAEEDKLVMPNSIALDPHAWDAPHLNSLRYKDKDLSQWMMGTIVRTSSVYVEVHGGLVRSKGSEPVYGWSTGSREVFDQACEYLFSPQEKQHVELAWYGEENDLVVRLFPEDETNYFDRLPPIYPDPIRYIRNWSKNNGTTY